MRTRPLCQGKPRVTWTSVKTLAISFCKSAILLVHSQKPLNYLVPARCDVVNFEGWLASLLGQREQQVQRLLEDQTALHFLIIWSLFESKCFSGFVKADGLEKFSERIIANESFDATTISAAASHFHRRYQDKQLYKNLMHKQSSPKMKSVLEQPFDSLQPQDVVFLVALTVYRFRNNIFHRNKGVASWLRFKDQIEYCIQVMKAFVTHAESVTPSLRVPHSE
jgi:hypothetical protein